MDILLQLFTPAIASEKWQWLWNIYNLCWAIFSTGILYVFFLRARKDKTISLIPGSWHSSKHLLALSISIGAEALIVVLSEFMRNPDVSFPFYDPLYSLTSFANKFLYIENVFTTPFSNLPWGNIAFRSLGVGCVLLVGKRFFQISSELSEAFYQYLNETINKSNTSEFVQNLWKLLKKCGLIGTTATTAVVIFATKEYRDEITNILDWLYSFLENVTLLSHLPKNASTFAEMANAFFVMIFSILIAAAYLLLIIAVCSVANLLWIHREDLAKKLKMWFREIGYIVLIIAAVIMVVLFSVLFATKSASFQEAVTLFVENSPRTIFVFLQHTLMLLAAVGIIALMICTLISVIAFGINFVKSWSNQIKVKDEEGAKRFLKIFGAAFLAGIVLACFIFGYDPIRGWLVERFEEDPEGHGLWWVAFQICSMLLMMVLVISAVLLSLYLIIWMSLLFYKEAKRVYDNRKEIRTASQRKTPLIVRIGEYLQSLWETVFRVFAGYRTESEKNNAVYVAACFASLASLINTAMGLHEFNIPLILAIVMSFAVQLAMLIFGMKAGQGIAENIVSDVKQVGANVAIAIVRRLAACFCYFLAFLASAYGICIAFKVENPELSLSVLSNTGDHFLPVLLIWCAILAFGYAGIKQLIELTILLAKWCRQKPWRKNKDRALEDQIRSEDDSGLLLTNPRKIPARYFLMAYLLFMIVSTGFAFTNLFGGYANQVQLHARINDQVYSETEKELKLQETTQDILREYNEIEALVLTSIQNNIKATLAQHEVNKGILEQERGKPGANNDLIGERQSYYASKTADFSAFCEMLQSVLTQDYDSFGKNMTLTIYEYSHFVKNTVGNNRTDEKYATTAICICLNDLEGKQITIGRINHNKDDDGDSRLVDIDSANYEVSVKTRIIENATKYTLLDEMLAIYEKYTAGIWNAPEVKEYYSGSRNEKNETLGDDKNNENNAENENDYSLTDIKTQLSKLEILDEVRRNIAELYFVAYPEVEQHVAMIDLPRVIDLYLLPENEDVAELHTEQPPENVGATTHPEKTTESPEDTTTPSEPTTANPTGELTTQLQNTEATEEEPVSTILIHPAEDTSDKDQAGYQSYDRQKEYQKLSDYVDRALQVYNILNVAGVVLEDDFGSDEQPADTETIPVDGIQPANNEMASVVGENNYSQSDDKTNSPTDGDKAYTIRKYRSYAKGVASSNFQISFDALFRGFMGLNDTDGRINALYSTQYVAVFILVICLLVDFMAFFAGLLLFQDAFILDMKKGSKLEKLGYINFDAVMTDYFMPTDVEGKTRWHQIALIYYLLHRRSTGMLDLQLIWMMKVDYHDFVVMINRTKAFLSAYGLAADSSDFHVWLTNFAKKKGIDFDFILN